MVPPNLQSLIQSRLPAAAARLVAALGNICSTPYQGRLLKLYILNHIFNSLDVTSLPVTINSQDALWDVAQNVVDAFFDHGRAAELGWVLDGANRETVVREELHGVVMRLLLLPAQSVQWKGEWTERLRRAAAGAVQREPARGRSLARRASLPEPLRANDGGNQARRPSLPSSLEYPRRRSLCAPEQQARDDSAKGDGVQTNDLQERIKHRAAEVSAIMRGEQPPPSYVKASRSGETLDDPDGDYEDEDEDADGNLYSAQQASIWTAIQEQNKRREKLQMSDAEWAELVERRIARETAVRGVDREVSYLDDSESGDEDEPNEGIDGNIGGTTAEAAGGDGSLHSDESVGSMAETVHGVQDLSLHHHQQDQRARGKAYGGAFEEARWYNCMLCKQRFSDADALNEHYLEQHMKER